MSQCHSVTLGDVVGVTELHDPKRLGGQPPLAELASLVHGSQQWALSHSQLSHSQLADLHDPQQSE